MGKNSYLMGDFTAATGKKSSIVKIAKFSLINPGFRAVCIYRAQDFFYRRNRMLAAQFFFQINFLVNGCELLPGCVIGSRLVIRHPNCIVIGQGTQIGSGCFLQHGVTFGVVQIGSNPTGEYPKVDNDVEIGSYAVIVGGVKVGAGATIGAHSLVNKDVPPNTVVAGAPARVVKIKI
jgi:serine acetyltransferase